MSDAALGQEAPSVLGLLDGRGADQDGLTGGVPDGGLLGQRCKLGLPGLVADVAVIDPDHRLVGGDRHHIELVGLPVRVRVLGRGPGHRGHAFVLAEIVPQEYLG